MNIRAIKDITNFIFVEDALQNCDVILIPGTSHYEITEKAAKIYREGYAPYVLPSGKFSSSLGRFATEKMTEQKYSGKFETDFDDCKHILMQNGVPECAILCGNESTNATVTLPNGNSRSGKRKSQQDRQKKKVSDSGSGSCRHRADRNASHERSPKTETDNFGITAPPTQAAVIT